MKQHITIEQLNELSQPARQALRRYILKEWAEPLKDARKTGSFAGAIYHAEIPTEDYFLSIGQMIEFLDREDMQFYLLPNNAYCRKKFNKDRLNKWNVQDGDYENAFKHYQADTLCDALWEAVKEVLNG